MALRGFKIAQIQRFDSVFGHFGHLSPVVIRGYRQLNVKMVKTNRVLQVSVKKIRQRASWGAAGGLNRPN